MGAGNVGGGRDPFQKTLETVSTRLLPAAIAGSLFLVPLGGPSYAQTLEISVDEETFLKEPAGRRLAEVLRGTRLALLQTEGTWAEVILEGWVPSASLGVTSREGHDRIVSKVGGETLATAPGGEPAARLLQGFLLDHVEDREGWTRVRRSGWVRRLSLAAAGAGSAAAAASPDRPPPVLTAGRPAVAGPEPVGLSDAPGGDTVAVIRSGTGLTITDRRPGWARVRVDGWVRSDDLVAADSDSVLTDLSAAALRASPDSYLGHKVRWRVQFIALERAEPERTDFYEGEPFILARAPDPRDGFVYVAVPSELLAEVGELAPLQMIDVLAQVRTGRSALMGVPVLDLVALF